jgi:hypothetical protein
MFLANIVADPKMAAIVKQAVEAGARRSDLERGTQLAIEDVARATCLMLAQELYPPDSIVMLEKLHALELAIDLDLSSKATSPAPGSESTVA